MSNGDENNNKPLTEEDKRRDELRRRGKEEELGRAERARIAAEARFDATKKTAAAEGRIMDALTAQIEKQKELAQYQIDYGALQEPQLTNERLKLRTLEAQAEIIKDTAASADKLLSKIKSMAQIPDVKAVQYFDNMAAAIAGMTANLEDAEDETSSLTEALGEVVKESFNANAILNTLGRTLITVAATGFTMIVNESIKLAKAADTATAAFTAQTGVVGSLRQGIVSLSRENLNLGVSFEDASKATTSLLTGFGDFIALSPTVQGNLKQSAVELQKIGLSTDTFASSLNELNNSFGLTPMMAEDTIKSLSALGIELGVGADKINQDFVASLPRLRVYGDSAVDVFEELAIAARAAGTSVSSLTGLLGEQFDTFEGSARIAGRLNAVLGTDMFSSTELLLANEAERLEILRERLAMSGVEFTNLGKFQQRALAAAAGINDVNEAAKIFGNTQESVAMQVGGLTLTQEELESRIQAGRDVTDKLKFALMSLAVAFEPVADVIATVSEKLVEFSQSMGGKGGVVLAVGLAAAGLTGFGLLLVRSVRLFNLATAAAAKYVAVQGASATATAATNSQLAIQNTLLATRGAAGGAGSLPGGMITRPSGLIVSSRMAGGPTPTPSTPSAPASRALTAGTALRTAGGAGTGALLGGTALYGLGSAIGLEGSGLGALTGLGAGAGILGGLALLSSLPTLFPALGILIAGTGLGAGIGAMASAQDGGITTQDGVMQVHKQEAIVPLDMFTSKLDELIDAVKSPSGDGNIVVKVMLNERELGEAIQPMIDRRVLGR